MTLKIAHLYYDLTDKSELYNIDAIKRFCNLENIKTEIHVFSTKDKINFNDYDLYYIGNIKNEYKQKVEIDLLNYKNEINNSISNKKHFLITGNSITLFKNIFYIKTTYQEEKTSFFKSTIIKEPLIGTTNMLANNKLEYHYKNLYAFTLTGPLLIKNPYLTKYLIKNIIKSKNKFFKYSIHNNITEIKAYKQAIAKIN